MWSRDEDFRVRRLASEATRPLLPWAPRIALPADAGLPVLETLYNDPHLYVRTSVANHLGDIAATQPDLALATLQRWKASGLVTGEQFAFLVRNALSNTLKEGWPPASALLGYAHDAPISLTPLALERTELRAGDTLNFSPVRQQHLVLPGVRPETVGPVREIVRAVLRLWKRSELGFVVELGVTELLTNVWRHTPGDCELLVRELADGVLVAVVTAPADDAEAGRGLLLLSALVDELDVLPLPCGKRVSFQLSTTADTAQHCPCPAA
ncbi:hypothetical protein OG552_29750 [Streptomyces sp. NBC_01476]|uniref:hypothetical protein n=1 Tax=Streptomyces sp. NBC_01476 TaxID=2903881 RepID=UPI002E367A17|nr:hypothetical protein [Streptomyces sp. NBC_01476]